MRPLSTSRRKSGGAPSRCKIIPRKPGSAISKFTRSDVPCRDGSHEADRLDRHRVRGGVPRRGRVLHLPLSALPRPPVHHVQRRDGLPERLRPDPERGPADRRVGRLRPARQRSHGFDQLREHDAVLDRVEVVVRCVLALILLTTALLAQPPRTVRQGGTLRLHGPAAAVSARLKDRTVRLFPQADGTTAGLLPIPADQKPGGYTLELVDRAGAVVESAAVTVIDAHFRKQNVTIAPAIAELKPSPGETETVTEFRNTVTETRHWSEPLDVPLRGCMTSPYGVQRYLNGKPTGSIHAGIDQRGAAGTPVHAVDGGVVKFAREWALHGRTVGVDHGQGLESIYLHMSKLAVAEGATVKKGDVVGYVGSTGRSTAPHLHWSIYVNGVPVNPLDWIKVEPCAAAAGKKGK